MVDVIAVKLVMADQCKDSFTHFTLMEEHRFTSEIKTRLIKYEC